MKSQALFENTLLRRFALKLIIVAVLPTILALDCSSTRPESESSAYFDVINQVRTGSRVDLDARGTSTFERDGNLRYRWVLRRSPRGSDAEITGDNIVNGSFIADMDGEYQVDLYTQISSGFTEDVFSKIIIASSGNAAPVAEAGAYKEVMVGSTVQLDAGGSYDADDDVLGYSWSFISEVSEPLTGHDTVNPTFVAHSIPYRLEVVANDGQVDSRSNTIFINYNRPGSSYPVAMAGPDQYVSSGSLVQLDSSASYSPEISVGNPVLLDYEWQMLHRPFSSEAVLGNILAVKPSFTADVDGAYVLRLWVTDDGRENRYQSDGIFNNVVVVFAGNGNIPPRANGGVDANVVSAIEVTLNGSNSSDAENAPLSYDWSIFKAPVGSSQALSTTNQISTSLTPDLNGIYLIRLVVNDGQDDSAPDIVRIIADIGVNLPPSADAGPDQPGAITGNQVTLDGSGSSDPENIPISYLWSIQQQPVGGTAVLSDANAMSPTFTPNVDGEYGVRLVVNDGSQQSLPDEVSVIASAAGPFIALDVITNLPFAPSIPEVDTLMMIDLATSNTLDLVSSINVPNGENDEHVALYATFDFTTSTAADFLTNPSWNLISRSHINPVSGSVAPSFIVQRISDSQHYKITMDFTADASTVVQIDAIQAWNCGASEANCPP